MTSASEKWRKIMSYLDEWAHLGRKSVSNGAVLIGQTPHVGPEAWLHTIYSPLTKEKIEFVQRELVRPFDTSFTEFLECSNGTNLFSDSLSIFGYRESYDRTGNAVWQPYDIIALNEDFERPKGMPKDVIVIGSYNWDGSKICLHPGGVIVRSPRRSFGQLNKWDNFWELIELEIARLSGLFDKQGKEIGNEPTVPKE